MGKQTRRPFDWCITDKRALLAGLRTRGASFRHEPATSELIHRAGREGIASEGIYFWHDYPKADRRTLSLDWSAATPGVNEKYAFIWQRFLDELSEPGEKMFVIATTQDNLVEFASDEQNFKVRFALDGKFIDDLALALEEVCSDGFSILALVRSLEEADAIRAQGRFEPLILRFCGPLPLKVHQPIVDLIRIASTAEVGLPLGLAGHYDSGVMIKHQSHDAARIFRQLGLHMVPWGECYALNGGKVLVSLADEQVGVFTAIFDGVRLRFSDGQEWARI